MLMYYVYHICVIPYHFGGGRTISVNEFRNREASYLTLLVKTWYGMTINERRPCICTTMSSTVFSVQFFLRRRTLRHVLQFITQCSVRFRTDQAKSSYRSGSCSGIFHQYFYLSCADTITIVD